MATARRRCQQPHWKVTSVGRRASGTNQHQSREEEQTSHAAAMPWVNRPTFQQVVQYPARRAAIR